MSITKMDGLNGQWRRPPAPAMAVMVPLLVLLTAPQAGAQPLNQILPLARVRQVRQLDSKDAAKRLPVQLRGTVTALSGWKNSFFLQDASGAISVDRTDSAEVHAGDEVEITGVSGPGMFAPVVMASRVGVLGRGPLPKAERSAYLDLASGEKDSQWVEVSGVVRAAVVSEHWGKKVLFLTMSINGSIVNTLVHDFPKKDFSQLVDATVRLRGVCGTIFNDKRQLMGVRIFAPSLENLQVDKPPPPDPFGVPALSLGKLFQFAPAQHLENRVKILATLTYQDMRPGLLYLQSGSDAVVAHSAQTTRLKPGAQVEVVGFLVPGQYQATLQDAIFHQVGEGSPPSPAGIRAADAIQEKDGFTFAHHSGLLTWIEGEIVEKIQHPSDQVWLMRDGDHIFQAIIDQGIAAGQLDYIRNGSRVRLTGICVVDVDRMLKPRSFTILLRSAADVAVLDMPWSKGVGSLWLAGLLLVLSLCMLTWVLQVRTTIHRASPASRMPAQADPYRLVRMARIAGLLCCCLSVLVLGGGWVLDVAILRSLLPGFAAMKPNTALGLLAAGYALWNASRHSAASRRLTNVFSAIVVLIGTLTLLEYVWGIDLRIDDFLAREITMTGSPHPGRMAWFTALTFVFAGCSLLLIPRKRGALTGQWLACAAGALCLLNLVGHLYGVQNPFRMVSQIGMTENASVVFLILCAGLLLLRPDSGLVATLTSKAPGGFMARRLLPAAFFAPIVLGWLRWQGQLHGLYDTSFGLALFATSNIVVFAFLIWTSAGLLNRSDAERCLAEDRMRETEGRYKNVIESLPQMVWICAAAGPCIYLSRQWVDYTGLPEDIQLGFGWTKQVHPEDIGRLQEIWQATVDSGGILDTEFRIRHFSGNYRWFRAMAVPLRGADGVITKWFGTSTDIDALKVMEVALRNSEASFRQLADAMPQMVWTATPDGNLDYYNQRWYDFTGMSFEQVKDWGWQPVLHPKDLLNCVLRWTHSFTTGTPYEVQYRFKRASDGIYRWHLGRAVPIRDANGEIVRWFGTCTDIEDYKQAEAAIKGLNEDLETRVQRRTTELALANDELVEIRAQLQGVLDAATQVSIISTDTEGVIRLFNSGAERMLQYKAAEMVGICTPEIIHDRAEVVARSITLSQQFGTLVEGFEVFAAALRKGESEAREWTYVRKDGSRIEVSLATSAVHNSEGTLTGFLGIATDITTRKSLERALRTNNENLVEQTRNAENANRAKSDFLASMSHEIRTPMNSILGMADLLWDMELTDLQRQYVEVFRRAGSNLLTLINDILDLSKIEAGHFEPEHIRFDLEDVIDETIQLMTPKARAKGIVLLSRLSPEVSTSLVGDPVRTRQVLINLLGNAVKFTDSGEVVLTIGCGENGSGWIDFAVSDTGIGIAPEKLNTIFENFTQADTSTTRKYGGTGLGLAISRRIVEQMGGQLTVTSSVGTGSTFRFTAQFECGPNQDRRLQDEVNDFYGKRVLIIDDNATNRLILRETLSTWGLEIDDCETPAQALASLSERSYALVLLDYHMPSMNGFELVAQIRKVAHDVPIVMLTSDTHPGDQSRRQQLGLAGFAVRPIKRAELLRLLCNALRTPNLMPQSQIPAVSQTPAFALPGSLKILIAEDSADNRLLVQAYLRGSPHGLTFVEDGEAAVKEFTEGRYFDLILMDMQMPRMDGLTATRAIREIERQRGLVPIPIIALTANARAEDAKMSEEAGCTAHLSKPISKHRLICALEEHRQAFRPEKRSLEPITVVVPDDLEELVPGYLEQRRFEVAGMMSLLAASDYERLRTLGHDMKGTGSSYGFLELTKLGGELESAAKRTDYKALALQIPQLSDYLSRVRLVTG